MRADRAIDPTLGLFRGGEVHHAVHRHFPLVTVD
jgi:hypothetical protein